MHARSLLLSALIALPGLLLAQDAPADSAPAESALFHRGQWAMQFGGGADLFSLGALRFTSARSAWLLDLDVFARRTDGEFTDGSGPHPAKDRVMDVGVRIGRRGYRTPRGKVVSFHSIAIEGYYTKSEVDFGAIGRSLYDAWSAGLYTDVGAAYHVASNLSLGGIASLGGGYIYTKQEQTTATLETDGFYLRGIRVVFAATISF